MNKNNIWDGIDRREFMKVSATAVAAAADEGVQNLENKTPSEK